MDKKCYMKKWIDTRVKDVSIYRHGHECHREDGPAIIYHDTGKVSWYLNGDEYSFIDWCNLTNKSKEEKIELALIYG